MTIVLDTDAASRLQRDQLPDSYRQILEGERLAISFVTVGETFKGAFKASWGPARLARMEDWLSRITILDYEPAIARVWGYIAAQVEKVGRPVLANDLWVAASCIARDLPLMTFNRRDFEHVPGLRLIP
ncbi:MAG: type II toxin-antitoxin system VapC family toxin [Actinomycetota bacterium]